MIKIAICDDDNSICENLEDILHNLELPLSEKFEIEVFFTGEGLCQDITLNNSYYDIIFLDIELSLLNGIEVGKVIRNQLFNETTQIIYISSKESYAIQLFKTRPLDFIIKPLNKHKIYPILKSALEIISNDKKTFQYKTGQASYKEAIKDILYFESDNRKINIVTTTNVNTFYGSLEKVHDKVPYFLNIHKSYLVNFHHVIKIEYDQLTMSNNEVLPISQPNRKNIRNLLLQLEKDGCIYD